MAQVFIMPVSGLFCSSALGWRGAYYLSGIATAFSCLAFFFTYRETSNDSTSTDHPEVLGIYSEKEKCVEEEQAKPFIPANKGDSQVEARIPYCDILTSGSFWGIVIVAFGDTVGYHVFLMYGPIYINKVLGFKVTETGFLAAMPYFCSMFTKTIGGIFLDRASCIREQIRVLVFTSASQAAMAACFVVLTQITPKLAMLGQSMMTLMIIFSGLVFVGLMNASRIISGKHNHITSSALSVQDSVAGLVVPALVALVAPNYDEAEWRRVFFIIVGFLSLTNVFFVLLTKVKPAKWTKELEGY
ncbi:hypothetical protein L596_029161 [Steinernema carpocapsae]|uniref:Major facilitator superfamily (MFS) profile domain-containing protein n=1 Tax=Steinernema carpocapsae TaxID=34508 RepID=A0A4U5LTU1_STECR|nr:hypothetical protein L596_029161 [Steinernema carpocapsae]